MKNTFHLLLVLITFMLLQKTAKAQIENIGFGCSLGMIHTLQPGNNANNLLLRNNSTFSYYKGILLRNNDDPCLDVGIGIKTVNIEREIQGVFPETNQYGVAIINTNINYWSIPITLNLVSRKLPRICFTYVPAVIANSKQTIQKYGGAIESEYLNKFPDDISLFQQSLLCSISATFSGNRSLFTFCFNPYFGIGTGLMKDQKAIISNFTYGLGMSITIDAPSIHITRTTHDNPSRRNKEEELKRKQEEIEKKLINKK
jgi:hypothetical protein